MPVELVAGEEPSAIAERHRERRKGEPTRPYDELPRVLWPPHRAEAHDQEHERRLGPRERERDPHERQNYGVYGARDRRGPLRDATDHHAEPHEEGEVERGLEPVDAPRHHVAVRRDQGGRRRGPSRRDLEDLPRHAEDPDEERRGPEERGELRRGDSVEAEPDPRRLYEDPGEARGALHPFPSVVDEPMPLHEVLRVAERDERVVHQAREEEREVRHGDREREHAEEPGDERARGSVRGHRLRTKA